MHRVLRVGWRCLLVFLLLISILVFIGRLALVCVVVLTQLDVGSQYLVVVSRLVLPERMVGFEVARILVFVFVDWWNLQVRVVELKLVELPAVHVELVAVGAEGVLENLDTVSCLESESVLARSKFVELQLPTCELARLLLVVLEQ